jgi:hypothetical protein
MPFLGFRELRAMGTTEPIALIGGSQESAESNLELFLQQEVAFLPNLLTWHI